MSNNITSADSEFYITVAGLYPAPQRLEGYMADRAWTTDAVDVVETVLGVDGNLSAGWIPNTTNMTVSIMPDSPSSDIFELIYATQMQARQTLELNGLVIIPGLKRKYTLTKGYLRNIVPIPGAAKVLEGRPFGIIWNRITVSPV